MNIIFDSIQHKTVQITEKFLTQSPYDVYLNIYRLNSINLDCDIYNDDLWLRNGDNG